MLCNQKMKKRQLILLKKQYIMEMKKIPNHKIKDLNIDSLDVYEIIMKIE